jgi:DNA (cytosine-5)-methyltransferase 1
MIKVIDIFAGPGGLSEGFSSIVRDGSRQFDIVLSIEKNNYAFQTLKLRTFFREFPSGEAPEEYYKFLRGELKLEELYRLYPEQTAKAEKKCWKAALGPGGVPISEVRKKIACSIKSDKNTVLIGGPPCQAYSLVGRSRNKGNPGYREEKDLRQRLYVEYLRVLADFKPAMFIMENVKGMLSAKLGGERIFDRILNDLKDPSKAISKEDGNLISTKNVKYLIYSLKDSKILDDSKPSSAVIKAENYGIPQARHRVILFGIREDLSLVPTRSLEVKEKIPISDVIDDFPPLRGGVSKTNDSGETWKKLLQSQLENKILTANSECVDKYNLDLYMSEALKNLKIPLEGRGKYFIRKNVNSKYKPEWYQDQKIGGIIQHETRSHMQSDILRYFYAACYGDVCNSSPVLSQFPKKLLPNHSNVNIAMRTSSTFSDRFRVQLRNRPSTTIVSHISKDGHYYIHFDPMQTRSLTVREAARIQTFPDNYYFYGPRTAQYVQVGNAVPPMLAAQIAEIVLDVFNKVNKLEVPSLN